MNVVKIGYNMNTKMDFYCLEIEALGGLLEATRKTFTLVKDNSMKLIKDLGKIKLNNDTRKRHYLIVECEQCGVPKTIRKGMTNKLCRSCSNTERATKHNMAGTRPYKIWVGMLQRTKNTKHNDYIIKHNLEHPLNTIKDIS